MNTKTGEEIASKKFYKAEFNQVLTNTVHRPYLDDFIEHVMIKEFNINELDEGNVADALDLE